MPSDFSYLPPASHALQFIACYQQFTITMYFSSLLISLPYSSVRVTSRDGNSLNLLKLFILCFDLADSSALLVVLQPNFPTLTRLSLFAQFSPSSPLYSLQRCSSPIQFVPYSSPIVLLQFAQIVRLHSSSTHKADTA